MQDICETRATSLRMSCAIQTLCLVLVLLVHHITARCQLISLLLLKCANPLNKKFNFWDTALKIKTWSRILRARIEKLVVASLSEFCTLVFCSFCLSVFLPLSFALAFFSFSSFLSISLTLRLHWSLFCLGEVVLFAVFCGTPSLDSNTSVLLARRKKEVLWGQLNPEGAN